MKNRYPEEQIIKNNKEHETGEELWTYSIDLIGRISKTDR